MNRDHAPIDDSLLVHSSTRFVRRTVAIGLISVAGIVIFVMLIPSMLVIVFLGPGVFFYQDKFEHISPDGRFQLRVRKRMNFPVDGIIDASGTVSVQARDLETSTLLDEKTFWIHEYPELKDPKIEWRQGTVAIREIETHNEVAFELKLQSQ
jgi:hypothetical protein